MTEWIDEGKLIYKVPIMDGCILHPCYEKHRRGKNWVATVVRNLKAPGGLERRFWKKGFGRYYIIPNNISIGDFLEFGGDYYSSSGKPDRNREYYRLEALELGALRLRYIDKADIGRREEPKSKEQYKRFIDLSKETSTNVNENKP